MLSFPSIISLVGHRLIALYTLHCQTYVETFVGCNQAFFPQTKLTKCSIFRSFENLCRVYGIGSLCHKNSAIVSVVQKSRSIIKPTTNARTQQDKKLSKEEILQRQDVFVGSRATEWGQYLNRHEEFGENDVAKLQQCPAAA